MDTNIFRGLMTLILMLLFLGLIILVYSPSQKRRFEKIGSSILGGDPNLQNGRDTSK